MACPGGCVGGAGVLTDVRKANNHLQKSMEHSTLCSPSETEYLKYLHLITKEDENEDKH